MNTHTHAHTRAYTYTHLRAHTYTVATTFRKIGDGFCKDGDGKETSSHFKSGAKNDQTWCEAYCVGQGPACAAYAYNPSSGQCKAWGSKISNTSFRENCLCCLSSQSHPSWVCHSECDPMLVQCPDACRYGSCRTQSGWMYGTGSGGMDTISTASRVQGFVCYVREAGQCPPLCYALRACVYVAYNPMRKPSCVTCVNGLEAFLHRAPFVLTLARSNAPYLAQMNL